MARAWTYADSDDQSDQDADYIQVEYRPGDTVNLLVCARGTAAELVGMPYARFLEMVAEISRWHDAEMARNADA